MIQSQKQSEIHPPAGPVVDRDYVRAFAQAHEQAGFDRILVPHHSTGPSATLTISYAAAVTERVNFMLAHRPGFTEPTLAARQIATLDQFSGGRLGVHFISGGSDSEQQRDGDFLDHDQRYARTDEYLGILRRIWTEDRPFDHEGTYYRFRQGFSEVKPAQRPHVPIYFGGASAAALEVAAKHADIYALWGESLDQVRELTGRVRAAAAAQGRQIRFSVSFRPILAATEDAAWDRARRILAETRRLREAAGLDATRRDVLGNRLGLRLVERPAGELYAALDHADLVAMDRETAQRAGLQPGRDSIGTEDARSPYASVLTIRDADRGQPWVGELVAAYHAEPLAHFLLVRYQDSVRRPW
nr:LLM class flavin-dependent oxidoreductase [Burkholderia sp. Ap-962]